MIRLYVRCKFSTATGKERRSRMLSGDPIEVGVAEVVDYLRITGVFAPALDNVVKRKLTVQEAKRKGIEIVADELQAAADAFRGANNLESASDTNAWLEANGVSLDSFEDYIETNLLISKFVDTLERDVNRESLVDSQLLRKHLRQVVFNSWIEKTLNGFKWG